MTCRECKHADGSCGCLCCCPASEIGCVLCILPVMAYRALRKLARGNG